MNRLLNLVLIQVITLAYMPVTYAACLQGDAMIGAIVAQNENIDATARHDKYLGMAKSPFSFFRATNHLFWSCYGTDSRLRDFGNEPGTRTWIQGDLHVDNFGTYNFGAFNNDNSERHIIYDLTDFDEAVVADYQYDVWRLAASLMVIAKHHGFAKKKRKSIIKSFSDAYLETLASFTAEASDTEQDAIDRHITKSDAEGKLQTLFSGLDKEQTPRKAMLNKLAPLAANGVRAFNTEGEKKLDVASPEDKDAMLRAFSGYLDTLNGNVSEFDEGYFTVKDVALRIKSGLGGLGLDRYYVLIEAGSSQDDDIVLDVKYQPSPTPLRYLPHAERELYESEFGTNHGQRQATAYWEMVGKADPYLGWMDFGERQFSVRERSPFKEALPISYLDDKNDFKVMAKQWGEGLAVNHAKAAKGIEASPNQFAMRVTANIGNDKDRFNGLVYRVAKKFAKQVSKDWETFRDRLSVSLATPTQQPGS